MMIALCVPWSRRKLDSSSPYHCPSRPALNKVRRRCTSRNRLILKLSCRGATLFRSAPKRAIVRAINPFNEPFRGELFEQSVHFLKRHTGFMADSASIAPRESRVRHERSEHFGPRVEWCLERPLGHSSNTWFRFFLACSDFVHFAFYLPHLLFIIQPTALCIKSCSWFRNRFASLSNCRKSPCLI